MNLLSRSAVFVALFATGAMALAAPHDKLAVANQAAELAAKAANAGIDRPVPDGVTTYSATIAASPTFNRPTTCAALSAVGTAVGFHVQQFTVSATGTYTAGTTTSTFSDGDGFAIIYQNAFNPASPLTNCVALDDDAGPGNLPLITTTLNAGTTYFLVTTTFDNGVTGDFTNSLDGPGTVTLQGAGPQANLGIVKTAPGGVVAGGQYTYNLAASNAGPDAATGVVVSDTLPAGVTFVSSTCGATAAGQAVTWNIGNLANGGNASCTLTVNFPGPCATVSNTATISGTEGDPNSSNNTSTTSNGGGNLVQDPSFEAGASGDSPAWTEASSNFGSPLCTTAGCGTGGGSAGPRTGTVWTWFGGIGALEVGSMEQALVIPTGATQLEFWTRFGACAGGAADFLRLTIDGTEVFRRDSTYAGCGETAYVQNLVNISSFANGASHTLRFESTTGTGGAASNHNLDDVSILGTPTCAAPAAADLALSQTSTAVSPVTIGTSFTKTLTVTNNGPGAATSFTVVDTLPAQLAFVSSTCGATAAGQVVTWTGGAIAFPGSASCTLTVQVVAAGSFSNTASITASAPADSNPANNTSTGPVVTGASPSFAQSVPANGTLWLAAMVGLLALSGWFAQRRRA
ncbi:MAG TPA: DUF11 domain-containing protein [Xanthomonadales bacterium]|nr:DUF11 domain-containing protein [Xanthomonadales bacterium]